MVEGLGQKEENQIKAQVKKETLHNTQFRLKRRKKFKKIEMSRREKILIQCFRGYDDKVFHQRNDGCIH